MYILGLTTSGDSAASLIKDGESVAAVDTIGRYLKKEIEVFHIMPTLSMFFGIVIRMYYAPKEHNPPHIHAIYQGDEAILKISDGEITEGKLPGKQAKLVQAWIEIHRDELIANWELCQNGEKPFPIEPLK